MTTFSLLISDLHLSDAQPVVTQQFIQFLTYTAPSAKAVYILGDLFEYWLGDDTLTQPYPTLICQALRQLSDSGVNLYLIHGNRDFLLGAAFAQLCGLTLLEDPCPIDLHGTPTLLMHGDTLCTDDTGYQQFRQQVRNPAWQQHFLSLPLPERVALARDAREQSTAAQPLKSSNIMDVNITAVNDTLRHYHYPRIIHGHTHRPALHAVTVDQHACERWVLPDWHATQAGWLKCDSTGCRFEGYP